jgi:hypothetical protein
MDSRFSSRWWERCNIGSTRLASAYYFKGVNLLSEAGIIRGKDTLSEALAAFRKYRELDPAG